MNLHQTITYSFLVAGYTKFAPDRCFGLLKKAYKVSCVSLLYEFARLVETSRSKQSTTHGNAQWESYCSRI